MTSTFFYRFKKVFFFSSKNREISFCSNGDVLNKLPLFSGTGLGLLIIYVTIALFMEDGGWEVVMRSQLFFVIILYITAIIISPLVMKPRRSLVTDSQKPSESKLDNPEKPLLCKSENNIHAEIDHKEAAQILENMMSCEKLLQSGTSLSHINTCSSKSCSLISQSKVTVMELLGYFATNLQFILCWTSFGFGGCSFDALMLHHPVRLASLGIKSGPRSLALNGLMQILARVPVGVIATKGYISPIRMSQIAKLSLVVSTLLCNFITGPTYQVKKLETNHITILGTNF